MKRLFPHSIQDTLYLSYILERYLYALEASPLQVRVSALAFDARIPESIFWRLVHLQENPDDAVHIQAADFHVVFSNILFRYPTVKIWQERDGGIFIEM